MSERLRVLRHGKILKWHHVVSICSLMVSGVVSANAAPTIINETRTYSHPHAGSDTIFGFGAGISSKYSIVLGGHITPTFYATEWNAAVFDVTTGQHLWTFTEPVPSNKVNFRFRSVAIDGDIAVIGTEYAGEVFVYDLATGVLKHKLVNDTPPPRGTDYFGIDVDIAGDRIVVGSRGYAHVFDANTGDQLAKIKPSPTSELGAVAVAISESAIVTGVTSDSSGASSGGATFSFDALTFAPLSKFVPGDVVANDFFGTRIAIDGNYAIASSDSGAYVFDATTGQQLRKLNLPGSTNYVDQIDIDGTTAIMGNPALERVMTFDWTTGAVRQDLVPSDYANTLNFGYSVGLVGKNAIVGEFNKAYQFQVVPEPSNTILLLAGLFAMVLRKN